jgi:hypothetical protein
MLELFDKDPRAFFGHEVVRSACATPNDLQFLSVMFFGNPENFEVATVEKIKALGQTAFLRAHHDVCDQVLKAYAGIEAAVAEVLPTEIAAMDLSELLRLWLGGEGDAHSWDWRRFCPGGSDARTSCELALTGHIKKVATTTSNRPRDHSAAWYKKQAAPATAPPLAWLTAKGTVRGNQLVGLFIPSRVKLLQTDMPGAASALGKLQDAFLTSTTEWAATPAHTLSAMLETMRVAAAAGLDFAKAERLCPAAALVDRSAGLMVSFLINSLKSTPLGEQLAAAFRRLMANELERTKLTDLLDGHGYSLACDERGMFSELELIPPDDLAFLKTLEQERDARKGLADEMIRAAQNQLHETVRAGEARVRQARQAGDAAVDVARQNKVIALGPQLSELSGLKSSISTLEWEAIGDSPSARKAQSRLHPARNQLAMLRTQVAAAEAQYNSQVSTAESHKQQLVTMAQDQARQERGWAQQKCTAVEMEQKLALSSLDGQLSARWEQCKREKKRKADGGGGGATIHNNITISGGTQHVAGGIGSSVSSAGGNFTVGGDLNSGSRTRSKSKSRSHRRA